jgi:hypothetical protein
VTPTRRAEPSAATPPRTRLDGTAAAAPAARAASRILLPRGRPGIVHAWSHT